MRLNAFTLALADLALLRYRPDYYAAAHSGPADVLPAVEVTDASSSEHDLGRKLAIYATAGIPELWMVDLSLGRLEIYASPTADGYQEYRSLGPGQVAAPAAFSRLTVEVGPLFESQ